jgi:copper transport protein
VLLAWLLAAAPALGHASLVSTEPKDGAVLAAAPSQLALNFNEPVQPIVLRLIDPTGGSVALTRYTIDGNRLVVTPGRVLGQGTHALSWRVFSADGHPVGGSLVFAIGSPSPTRSPILAGDTDRQVRAAIWLARVCLFLALFIGVGGAFFAASIGVALPAATRTALVAFIVLGQVAAVMSIGLQGLDILLAPLSRLIDPQTWRAGYATSYGTTATIAFVALLAAYASVWWHARRIRMLLAVAALAGLGAAFVSSGHVSTAAPVALSRTVLFVHVVCIAFWIGALAPLLTLMRSDRARECDQALERFSRVIPFPLAALVVTGGVLAVIQLDHVDALWLTNYGWVLGLKLLVLLGLFMLAAVNRFVLTPAWRRKSQDARPRFVRTLRAELALIVLIFAIVALWRFTPPPRSLIAAREEPVFTHIHTQKAMADITIARSRAGLSRISIVLQTGDFRPLSAKEVTLLLANPAAGIEPISRPATPSPDKDAWHVNDLMLPASGAWAINLEVLIDDFERIELVGEFDLRR